MKVIHAGMRGFAPLNEEIREALRHEDAVRLEDVNGQRYIGCAMERGKFIEVHGAPGNDMAAYLDGGRLEVFGNAQEAVGNTMGGGEIVIHGHAGDALGYAMRDGSIYIQNRVGCRAGIHIKEYGKMHPNVVIGGVAGAFLGEYMAGGTIVVLGLGRAPGQPVVGAHCATGMHGGRIFIRGELPQANLSANLTVARPDEAELRELRAYAERYCAYFGGRAEELLSQPFYRLTPTTARPYANLYTSV